MRKQFDIHRHIGGLENQMIAREAAKMIHRHTGGLEKIKPH